MSLTSVITTIIMWSLGTVHVYTKTVSSNVDSVVIAECLSARLMIAD